MGKWLPELDIDLDSCDDCGGSCDITKCEICNKNICCWCEDSRTYDEHGSNHGRVCKKCANKNNLITYEEYKPREFIERILSKIEEHEELDDDERNMLIDILKKYK